MYPTKLVGYKYVEKYVELIPQHFLKEKKIHFFGVGAPTSIFEPYISSYNHIFGQNAAKFHFIYPTKLVAYEYVEKNVEKISIHFLEEKKLIFFLLKLQHQFFSLKSALTNTFLIKMPQNCTFCIQLN